MSVPRAVWLNDDEINKLSGPKGQKAVMGMRYFTGSKHKIVPHVLVLYEDGVTEFTHRDKKTKPNWSILLHQEARKKGYPVTGEINRARHNKHYPTCPACKDLLRLCLCNLN